MRERCLVEEYEDFGELVMSRLEGNLRPEVGREIAIKALVMQYEKGAKPKG